MQVNMPYMDCMGYEIYIFKPSPCFSQMCYFTGVYYNIVSVEILDPIWKMRKLLAQLLNSKYVYWVILLMVQKSQTTTCDGIIPCK